jgi:uncharacterized damage-inducible protein DinB
METLTIERAEPGEYAEAFGRYVALVPPGDVLMVLREQIELHLREIGALSETQAAYRYAADKWTVKDVIGHLADVERIFTYRALCFARGDTQTLPAFDDEAYVRQAQFTRCSLARLLGEFRATRAATVAFFGNLTAEALTRRGTANNREYTVRAIAAIVAGHEAHHWRIFRERYLPGMKR